MRHPLLQKMEGVITARIYEILQICTNNKSKKSTTKLNAL